MHQAGHRALPLVFSLFYMPIKELFRCLIVFVRHCMTIHICLGCNFIQYSSTFV